MKNSVLLTITAALSLLAYFLVNTVLCTLCPLSACVMMSVGVTFLVVFSMWVFILFTKYFL